MMTVKEIARPIPKFRKSPTANAPRTIMTYLKAYETGPVPLTTPLLRHPASTGPFSYTASQYPLRRIDLFKLNMRSNYPAYFFRGKQISLTQRLRNHIFPCKVTA